MYRPVSSPSFKERAQALAYPAYITLIALVVAVVGVRMLTDYNWLESAFYGATLVISFWLGQYVMGALQQPRRRDEA